MYLLFVHGMGRSPLSAWPLLRHLSSSGFKTSTFSYSTALEDFDTIKERLTKHIAHLAELGDYVLVGHSLGGVLLRSAVNHLPPKIRQPCHVFLLGSPQRASKLAQLFSSRLLFRLLTRDCGHLLSSPLRMSEVGTLSVPTTNIIGIRSILFTRSKFENELNDGVVAISEVTATWVADEVHIPVIHTLLPSSKLVAQLILERVCPH